MPSHGLNLLTIYSVWLLTTRTPTLESTPELGPLIKLFHTGLKNLQLSSSIKPLATKPAYFPTLTTVEEVPDKDKDGGDNNAGDSDIQEIMNDDDDKIEVIDPNDASKGEQSPLEAEPSTLPSAERGIGHTLMKVDYICCRISSSAARRSEFKLVAKSKLSTAPGLIAGYRIQWGVAYNSWVRAYQAKKVINQMLENKTDRFAGKSASAHFFIGYEISKKEWENINSLTIVLEEFLALTLNMEGDVLIPGGQPFKHQIPSKLYPSPTE
ncbi:hypothetical protein MJO28_001489 [Puccinia striiformis f. sp. tritici]|uniref:Uncharacterized protein n=1 Tax=Puccinia striiformis f. sp. tritici TaxID=168172 RepID=A0ACC0EVW1_9BASI|nr:hypothetical protein MJO28_001489 [Puccinia striiformis f. sp. tritici]